VVRGCLKRVSLSLKCNSWVRSQTPKPLFSPSRFSVAGVVKSTFQDFSNILLGEKRLIPLLIQNLKSKIGSVKYFSAPENRDLGIVKLSRKQKRKLVVSPFPTTQRSPEQFFFQPPGSNFNLSDVTEINLSSYTH